MKRISSKENPFIKRTLRLKRAPEKFLPSPERPLGEVLIETTHLLQSALDSGVKIKAVGVTEAYLKRYYNLVDRLLQREVPVSILEEGLVKALSETVTPQGVLAIGEQRAWRISDIPEQEQILVTSDRIQDPGNMGTLLRVTDAVGLGWFICLKGSANPFNPKSLRASAGSVFHLKVAFGELDEFLTFIKERGLSLVCTDQRGDWDLFQWSPTVPMAVVFGNEAGGIRDEILRRGIRVQIPIYGRAESLNVAISAGVFLYEVVRRLKSSGIL